MNRHYVARRRWVWLDDCGRWQPAPSWATPATTPTCQNASARRRPRTTAGDAGGRAEIAVAEQPDGIPAAAGSALSAGRPPTSARRGSGAPPARRLRPPRAVPNPRPAGRTLGPTALLPGDGRAHHRGMGETTRIGRLAWAGGLRREQPTRSTSCPRDHARRLRPRPPRPGPPPGRPGLVQGRCR